MIGTIITDCLVIYSRFRHSPDLGPDARLRKTIGLLIGQNEDPETALLFPELWALAEREPVASDATEKLYQAGRELLAELISAVHPGFSRAATDEAARLVMALADGLLISSGTRCGRSRTTFEERERFIAVAIAISNGAI